MKTPYKVMEAENKQLREALINLVTAVLNTPSDGIPTKNLSTTVIALTYAKAVLQK